MTPPTEHDFSEQARQSMPLRGGLYVVATPIGNLADITFRAVATLQQAHVIGCEDTRVTRLLCQRYGIHAQLVACHDHNQSQAAARLVAAAQVGQVVALVSDAGTPAISDPGAVVVDAFRSARLPVYTVPGPSAAVATVALAGSFGDGYLFLGFLASKGASRTHAIAEIAASRRPVVLYEAPHRIEATVSDLVAACGESRRVCLARELTKVFEESAVMPLGTALAWLASDRNRTRGEFSLLVEGAADALDDDVQQYENLLTALLAELPASRAARVAAQVTGGKRQALYALAMTLKPHADSDE